MVFQAHTCIIDLCIKQSAKKTHCDINSFCHFTVLYASSFIYTSCCFINREHKDMFALHCAWAQAGDSGP